MLLEVIGFVGAVIVLLTFFAEQKKPVLGMAASVLLMVLAFWILTDGIQIKTGEITSIQDNSISSTTNSTILSNSSSVHTLQYVYVNVPTAPYVAVDWLFGNLMVLLSVYGLFHYIFVMIAK